MKRLLSFLFLFVILVSCIDNLVQSTLYQAERANTTTPMTEQVPSPMKKIDLRDAEGNRTVGWYYEYSQSAPTVVYFHGNASNVKSTYENGLGEKLISLKVNFAILDYPSYGLSTGEPSEKTVVASGQTVLDFMKSKFPQSEFIIWGRSLGCAPATIVTKNNHARVSKLILTTPWDSFWKLIKSKASMSDSAAKKAAVGNEYESEVHAKSITMPVLIHHGTADVVVPWSMGKNLSGAFASNDVTFVSIEGADHNNLLGNQEWDEIARFLRY